MDTETLEQIDHIKTRLHAIELANDQRDMRTTDLANQIGTMSAVLHAVVTRLWGDDEARQKYETARAAWTRNRQMHMCPMPPHPTAPGPGEIEMLTQAIESLSTTAAMGGSTTETRVAHVEKELERRLGFIDKVSAWMGPLMDDPEFQPPMNAEQVASKKWVDKHLEVLAASLRRSMTEIRANMITMDKWVTDEVNQIRQGKPSRVAALRRAIGQIITGDAPR